MADEADRPAAGVHVTLYKLGEDDRAIRLTQALTDDAGRVADLLGRPMSPGVYRLEFNLAGGGFFRRLTVDLRVEDVGRSYEVPLVVGSGSLRVAGGD